MILFDVAGVLLTNGWDRGERTAAIEHFHLDLAAFESRQLAPYDAWERGWTPVAAYLDATVFFEPRGFSHDEFFAFMLTQSQLQPDGALGILKELAASNQYLLGAFNNEPRETNEYRFQRFGLRELFQVTLCSCYLGLRKPEPAIYQQALGILGKPAERVLFIDTAASTNSSANRISGKDAGRPVIGLRARRPCGANLRAWEFSRFRRKRCNWD